MLRMVLASVCLSSAVLGLVSFQTAAAQVALCGVVDAIDYPIDNLVEGYDDFALYRRRFGGNHVGIDIGFDRWGDPVHAAARGRVTYSDPEGWDTEKGVVIVEHTLPDGSIAYTLYGHMEQTDTLFFPQVGQCVERGDILGGIGWPSRGRPHLHYEIRNFLPDDGGPGYVTGSPLQEGWYHPLDFTQLWRARLIPSFLSYTTFDLVPTLPPILVDDQWYAVASGSTVEGIALTNEVLWRVQADNVITGLGALPTGQVIVRTRSGQVVVLQSGRYAALWTVSGPDEPFIILGETVIFVTDGGGLVAYDGAGNILWMRPPISESARVVSFQAGDNQVALSARADKVLLWRLVDGSGQVLYEMQFNSNPLIEPDLNGDWLIFEGAELVQVNGANAQPVANVGSTAGRAAAMTVDVLGSSYIYLAGVTNRLISVGLDGQVRWRVEYPHRPATLPPLLRTGNGCLLYALDMDGMLNVFNTEDGALINQVQLYAGGSQTGSPRGRMLRIDRDERVQVGAGFLTTLEFDGWQLGGEAAANCLLG